MSSLGLHLLHGACPLTWLFNLSALILHTKTLLKRKKTPLYKWGYWSPRKLTNLLQFIQWLVGGYPRLSNFITYPLISHQTIKPFSDKLSEQWDYIENWCLDLPHTLQLFLKHHFFFSSVKVEEISNCPFINYFHNNFNIILLINALLVKAIIFPVSKYGCENRTIKKAEH